MTPPPANHCLFGHPLDMDFALCHLQTNDSQYRMEVRITIYIVLGGLFKHLSYLNELIRFH
jgi:hypothetical protein